MKALELKEELISKLAACERIKGIGQTGNMDMKLIPGKSDIDLFVICTEIPAGEERQACYKSLQPADFTLQMEICSGGIWGYGDILVVDGIDVMPMYFTIDEMYDYLKEVLSCKHMWKEGNFYPVGRLASIFAINILYEEDTAWTKLKDMVNEKPTEFFRCWFEKEIGQVLDDEDLGRAELRGEVLFFHQVLEEALDHLLQAIFAVNFCYFPSRKRTLETIGEFQNLPDNCNKRLLKMIENGASHDTINDAITDLCLMTHEVSEMGISVFSLKK